MSNEVHFLHSVNMSTMEKYEMIERSGRFGVMNLECQSTSRISLGLTSKRHSHEIWIRREKGF